MVFGPEVTDHRIHCHKLERVNLLVLSKHMELGLKDLTAPLTAAGLAQSVERLTAPLTAAGLAQSVERLTAERKAAGSIPRVGPMLRVLY